MTKALWRRSSTSRACTVGHKFYFEPVPTDVEVHDGLLYVTTLPGGPEDPSLGARGKVYTVDPATGDVTKIGSGFRRRDRPRSVARRARST